MSRSFVIGGVVVALVLLGCGSFNNSFNTYTAPPQSARATPQTTTSIPDADLVDEPLPPNREAAAVVKPAVDHGSGTCPVTPWPEPGTPPPYPYKAMLAADGNLDQIERIERGHIDELRAYVSERRKLNRVARLEFEEKCVSVPRR